MLRLWFAIMHGQGKFYSESTHDPAIVVKVSYFVQTVARQLDMLECFKLTQGNEGRKVDSKDMRV